MYHPTVGEDIRSLGLRSVIGVPCAVNERILAVAFVMDTAAPSTFTADKVELAQGVASRCAGHSTSTPARRLRRWLSWRNARGWHRRSTTNWPRRWCHCSSTILLIDDLLTRQELSQAQAFRLHEIIHQANVDVREAILDLIFMASLQMCGLAALADVPYPLMSSATAWSCTYKSMRGGYAPVGQTGTSNPRLPHPPGGADQRAQAWEYGLRPGRPRARGTMGAHQCEDEGQGFDPALVRDQYSRGFGLQVTRERAEGRRHPEHRITARPGHSGGAARALPPGNKDPA